MKNLILLATVLVSTITAHATLYSTNWNSGAVIPDNNPSGWADSREVNTMPAGTLLSVAVNLNLSGGWNGDLYAYLVNDTGFAVLLDRVGPGLYGYGDPGMNVVFADNGTAVGTPLGNINNYQTVQGGPGVPVLGSIWNPDNSGSGPNSLSSFLGGPANGTWSLFIADLSAGGVTTVTSWGLQMDIVAVPEVETWIAAALAGAFGAFWLSRQIWSNVDSGNRQKELKG